jgi:penicillin-binding protein 1A
VLRRRRSDKAPKRPRRRIRKLRLSLLLCVLGLCGTAAFAFGFVTAIASDIPSIDPANSESHVEKNGYIYAADGQTLAVLRGDEARIILGPDDIAPIMKQAIVAVEDRRFYEHRGVDLRGIFRAVWADVRNKEVVQGGSTITQQLVKNTYIEPERTVSRKLKEAALAWQLERRWSKDRILTAYLNTIYFGNGAYGIGMAARVYFGKQARDLTLAEAALLAGIPVNPTAYDPVANPTRAKGRRDTVLALMFGQALITKEQYDTAREAPLPSPDQVHLPGTRGPAQYFAEYVKSQLVPYYGSGKVFGGGLKVYTTIDLGIQKLAHDAIEKWLPDPEGPQAALVAINPQTGDILAMVGGTSFSKSQFNLAVQGERQPGSSFKPFVLATALGQGISPSTTFVSRPQVISLGDKLWAVSNYENNYLGTIDLTEATIESDNTVYAQLTAQLGPQNVVRMAHRLGIESPLGNFLAIGLGSEAVNPLEMARAFSTFANGGVRLDGSVLGNVPRAVRAVEDDGRLERNAPVGRRILDSNVDAMLTSILQGVVRQGTGVRAALDDRPVAGKTGTTENYGDAWFVGFTPQLAVAVWVGYPDRLQPMLREFNGGPVAGGTFPALIFKTFAKSAFTYMEGKKEYSPEPEYFPQPSYEAATALSIVNRDGTLMRDNGQCKDVHTIVYFSGFEPPIAPCKPNEVEVPNVVGASVEDAVARLRDQPLFARVLYRPLRPDEKAGVVFSQTPAGGTLGALDTVTLVAAKPSPFESVAVVPRLVGLTLPEALQKLEARDLQAQVQALTRGEPGVIESQLPVPGRGITLDEPVTLFVGA